MPNYLRDLRLTFKSGHMGWTESKEHSFPLRVLLIILGLCVNLTIIGRELKHDWRRRIGDPTRRPACCALRPAIYEGAEIRDIPDFSNLMVSRSAKPGYIEYCDCKICGQAWARILRPEGKGLRSDVEKI